MFREALTEISVAEHNKLLENLFTHSLFSVGCPICSSGCRFLFPRSLSGDTFFLNVFVLVSQDLLMAQQQQQLLQLRDEQERVQRLIAQQRQMQWGGLSQTKGEAEKLAVYVCSNSFS